MENLKNIAPIEDFNWDAYENGDAVTSVSKEDLEKAYDSTLNKVNDREVVDGTVIAMNKREVVVNIGYKSDGIIPLSEFRYNPDLKVGDTVEVYIENQEDKKGQLILSHKKARATRSWDRVNAALENEEIIKGYIKCRTKGGMIVDVFGIEAFLPGSQIDVKPIRDYDVFVGKTMEFKVVKINQEFKNVVVSHKALIEAELEQQKKEIISKLEKGQVLEGTVKNITSYGVFIDLGGVDGLIHITDLSWGRVSDPREVVSLDQKLNVVILDFDDEKKRIALGLKQLTPHPWDALDPNLKVGDHVKGKVVVMADYGAFIEIAPGVEGLIHVSEMSWSQHLRSAQDFMKVGDEVEAVILTLDREERKMSLGIKQLKADPWETIEEKYPVGSKHVAKVRNFTNFGVFVEIEEGVDGLIHISDLSWTKKIKHPSEFTQIGADIEVQVLEIDKDYDDDLGIEFENQLMSDYKSCSNKCIFCFIDQMPPGMRDTLYFKADDSRLSFLQGNYITLTNMRDKDIERVIKYHLSPINISVHTTNPELRCKMLHNRFAGDVLDKIGRFYEAGIRMNSQVVLCQGLNDEEELDRTISDLGKFIPHMESLSVVPVGLTKYREGLAPLKLFGKEDAKKVLKQIHKWQDYFRENYGTTFVHASDEWFILAGQEFPDEAYYEGYGQLENGVVMMRLLL